MTQEAVVTKLLPNGMAEVAVKRTTACGGNCASCEACVFESQMKTPAKNSIEARPGQKVLIESQSSRIFRAAFLVYVLPLLTFLGGYFIGFESLPGCAEAIIARCKKAGVTLTPAGATWPYGRDPNDSSIRIAPTFPSMAELKAASELFALCVRLVSAEKLAGG